MIAVNEPVNNTLPTAPPILDASAQPSNNRALALYLIIAFKFAKGLLLMGGALAIYNLAGPKLSQIFQDLQQLSLMDSFGAWLKTLEPVTLRHYAVGIIFYAAFSLVEGTGLLLRAGWAGWAAIGESAFFVPLELIEVLRNYSTAVALILAMNIAIVWYLYRNRVRLFGGQH